MKNGIAAWPSTPDMSLPATAQQKRRCPMTPPSPIRAQAS